jgi:hypothetical protein
MFVGGQKLKALKGKPRRKWDKSGSNPDVTLSRSDPSDELDDDEFPSLSAPHPTTPVVCLLSPVPCFLLSLCGLCISEIG